MNWQKYFKFFNYLDEEQADYFATPEKAKKAVSTYNRALKMLKDKNNGAEAIELMRTIADDYPMFPEPSHIYGISLAQNGNYEEALVYLKRVSLLDISDEMANMLQEQFVVINREIKIHKNNLSQINSQKKNTSKHKTSTALNNVLIKATDKQTSDLLSKSEINAINKKLGNENPIDLNEEIKKEKQISDRRFIITLISVATIIFLIFYFAIRPAILNSLGRQGQTEEQLQWLEKEITNRAKDDTEIDQLLKDYLSKFSDNE